MCCCCSGPCTHSGKRGSSDGRRQAPAVATWWSQELGRRPWLTSVAEYGSKGRFSDRSRNCTQLVRVRPCGALCLHRMSCGATVRRRAGRLASVRSLDTCSESLKTSNLVSVERTASLHARRMLSRRRRHRLKQRAVRRHTHFTAATDVHQRKAYCTHTPVDPRTREPRPRCSPISEGRQQPHEVATAQDSGSTAPLQQCRARRQAQGPAVAREAIGEGLL